MEIRFGLALDGAVSIQPVNRLGYACVGPLGFLSLLEIELGLARPPVGQGKRITQFGLCLQAFINETRFYHRSFADDPVGVAKTLLNWRDQWYLAGWNGTFEDSVPERLKDFAELEVLAREQVAPSIGERLADVSAALSTQRTQIKSVELADPLLAFPLRWREVLMQLPTQEMSSVAISSKSNDLTQLQSGLQAMNQGASVKPFSFKRDGSLIVLEGGNSIAMAHAMAECVAKDIAQTLIVAEQDAILLDETFAVSGLPSPGVSEPSALKPALQLLPLTLELMWQPLDVNSLLEFLTHSMVPIDWLAARSLAQAVAATPGIGGEAWKSALNKAVEKHDETLAKRIVDAVEFWLMHKRHDRNEGLPLVEVQCRVEALAQHHGKTLARLTSKASADTPDSALLESVIASMGQCRAFLENLDLLVSGGDSHLSMRKLQQLLDLATNDAPRFGRAAEVGHAIWISNPGAAIEAAETVIWWQMSSPGMPRSYPWSSQEILALVAAGVQLQPLGDQLQQIAATWLRPVLAAQSRLILVMPDIGQETHPVWHMIKYLATGISPISLEDFLAQQKAESAYAVEHRSLPALSRWWQLPEDIVIPKREVESFSSLSVQVENPSKWVLNYVAKLRPTEILTLADGPTLNGTLLHRLFEDFFNDGQWRERDPKQTEKWFKKRFETLVDEEGLVLRLPGRQADLARLRDKARIALLDMLAQLQSADVVSVECEQKVEGVFCGGKISGYADLVLRNKKKAQAIVDLKWGNYKNKYGDLLANNRHVQLALYSKLLATPPATLPVAYYILSQAQLLAHTRDYFPGARVAPNAMDENATQLWQRFEKNWKWRRKQFNKGLIEVVTEMTEADSDSEPPEEGLPAAEASDRYNDYVRLAGWGEGA